LPLSTDIVGLARARPKGAQESTENRGAYRLNDLNDACELSLPHRHLSPCATMRSRTPATDLLRIERSRDAAAITVAINQVLATTADLLDIEMAFRAAACASYLVATTGGFEVIVGVQAWIGELDRLGRMPEQNRDALAKFTVADRHGVAVRAIVGSRRARKIEMCFASQPRQRNWRCGCGQDIRLPFLRPPATPPP
jgi:hypothetical protein